MNGIDMGGKIERRGADKCDKCGGDAVIRGFVHSVNCPDRVAYRNGEVALFDPDVVVGFKSIPDTDDETERALQTRSFCVQFDFGDAFSAKHIQRIPYTINAGDIIEVSVLRKERPIEDD